MNTSGMKFYSTPITYVNFWNIKSKCWDIMKIGDTLADGQRIEKFVRCSTGTAYAGITDGTIIRTEEYLKLRTGDNFK